jgi:hypothetical protein
LKDNRMSQTHKLQAVFWLSLSAFLAWDFLASDPVDLRNEPPLIAAGSGQATSGGHCSMAK